MEQIQFQPVPTAGGRELPNPGIFILALKSNLNEGLNEYLNGFFLFESKDNELSPGLG